MILDKVYYPVAHFSRAISSRMVEPSYIQLFLVFSDKCLVPALSSLGVYGRPLCLPLDATLLIVRSLHHLFKNLDLPSGEGAEIH